MQVLSLVMGYVANIFSYLKACFHAIFSTPLLTVTANSVY